MATHGRQSMAAIFALALAFVLTTNCAGAFSQQLNDDFTVKKPDPSNLECNLCKVVVKDVASLNTTNASQTAKVLAALGKDCDKLFKANSTLDKACRSLGKEAVALLPQLEKQINTLAWDETAICAALGQCLVPCCLSKAMPEQTHISLGDDPSTMAAMWTTHDLLAGSVVQWGSSAGAMTSTAVAANTTYTHWGWRGHFYTAAMTALLPSTRYYYRVGSTAGFSQTFSFKTLSSTAGEPGSPLRIGFVADMGYANHSDDPVRVLGELARNGSIDLMIHNGDVSYADGDFGHWDVFMRKIEPIAASVPYMVVAGNHEIWFNFSAYKTRFAMPGAATWRNNMFYSFHAGSVHFSGVNTESPIDLAEIGPRQVEWIKADLNRNTAANAAAVEARQRAEGRVSGRAAANWTIVYTHRPFYCSNTRGSDILKGNAVLRGELEEVLLDNHVDLVVSGHVHDYERTLPIRNGNATQQHYTHPVAPVYVIDGAGGNREGLDRTGTKDIKSWSRAYNGVDVSVGLVTVEGCTLQWEQIAAHNGTVFDTFTIQKC